MKPAIFLDRDGTIIEETHYIRDPDKVRLLPRALDALLLLRKKGYLLFVVSNQSGVGRGLISRDDFSRVHKRVVEILETGRITVDDYLYCFHSPDENCGCRKPKTGLVPKTFKENSIDFARSFTIGDKAIDVELGRALGSTGILVLTGYGKEERPKCGPATPVYATLFEAAESVPSAGGSD